MIAASMPALVLLVLLVLQVAALSLYLSGRHQNALWPAGAIPLLSLAVASLLVFPQRPGQHLDAMVVAFLVIQAAALVAATAGIVVRSLANLLFWPIWAANCAALLALIYLTFFFHVF